ncbi:Putative transcriptional regulator [Sphingopyxis fribergensis]|uniref:Putative transcriptional regulator n=1 Tax=Sphingopyxis fribergensis TaxID=1515612 RepID=A0A0A7PB47_9SPHN|nr:LysR family transcriptional regulator [Sphingopyxis fribergensis]AJA07170.1 Putative transcriptional regulator [Sphingopyxis fribergensis]
MARENLNDLAAFVTVARERSFTRAAAQLGVSQSALSQTIRLLEARMGVRLLTRTTRSVSSTAAGERLFQSLAPHLDEIDAELQAISDMRDKPSGTIRITAADYTIDSLLWPRLNSLLPQYPDIKVELVVDYGLTDIVAERFDAGVRMGDQIAKDMISVPIGPAVRFAVVGAPSYMRDRDVPIIPQDLLRHNCVNLRLPTYGSHYAWEFEKGDQELKVRVDGQLAFNSVHNILAASLAGHGLAFLPEDMAMPYLADGRFVRLLEDWCPPWEGYHLYYPSRRQTLPALRVIVDALRYRPSTAP